MPDETGKKHTQLCIKKQWKVECRITWFCHEVTTHKISKMQQKHLFQACSSLSFSFFVNLWMRPKGSVSKLIGKHFTFTKAKILKISKTNETVLRKSTNPLCLNASFSSWTARSTTIAMHARQKYAYQVTQLYTNKLSQGLSLGS